MSTMTDDTLKAKRLDLLGRFTAAIIEASRGGLFAKTPISIKKVIQIPGPRTGILELHAGYFNGALLKGLEQDEFALVRQLVWDEALGDPQAYLSGKGVRVEIGWSPELTTSIIPLNTLSRGPRKHGCWVLGQNVMGETVTLSLDNEKPHGVVAGTTGSGKSVTLQSAAVQLAAQGDYLVLIDGKFGDGLFNLDRLKGAVGPLAVTPDDAQRALAWAGAQMVRRYTTREVPAAKIIVIIDEIQEYSSDPIFVELVRKIASQGRSAGVHLILATQHPTNDVLGDATIKRNTPLRVGLRVSDAVSSQVALGQSTPRLDKLLGQGDCWTVTPRATHRNQVAILRKDDFLAATKFKPQLSAWPELSATLKEAPDLVDMASLSKGSGSRAIQFSGTQIALAVQAQSQGLSRAELIRQLEHREIPVSRKTSTRLWDLAAEVLLTMEGAGANLMFPEAPAEVVVEDGA